MTTYVLSTAKELKRLSLGSGTSRWWPALFCLRPWAFSCSSLPSSNRTHIPWLRSRRFSLQTPTLWSLWSSILANLVCLNCMHTHLQTLYIPQKWIGAIATTSWRCTNRLISRLRSIRVCWRCWSTAFFSSISTWWWKTRSTQKKRGHRSTTWFVSFQPSVLSFSQIWFGKHCSRICNMWFRSFSWWSLAAYS